MDVRQQGIITLVKSAVLQQPLTLPEGFDIESAADMIKHHHMVPLAYEGAVWCGISRQHPVMRAFFQHYCRALQTSERQMKSLHHLFAVFEENGIDYMPLKGCRMKALYPKPELRLMGDADILIRMEQYDVIKPLLFAMNFSEEKESDHELPWRSDALYLELHKRLVPSYNKDFYAYYKDGWQLAKQCSGTQCSMTPEDEWIYLFTHFAKHYRDGGIGCRHVADLWVFRSAYPDLDEVYIKTELEKLELTTFYTNTCRLLDVWFEGKAEDEVTEVMTDYIFASGSWGNMESRVLSLAVRGTKHIGSGKLAYLRQIAFPPLEMLKGKYTVLKKSPFLLPLIWLIRPFYKVLFEFGTLHRQKQDMEMLDQEKVQTRQQLLRYVGFQ